MSSWFNQLHIVGKVLLIGAFVLSIILFASICAIVIVSDDEPQYDEQPANGAAQNITITAEDLWSVYQTNAAAADVKYNGKAATITGLVTVVESTSSYYDVKLFANRTWDSWSEQYVEAQVVCKVNKDDRDLVADILDIRSGDTGL